MMIWYRLTLLSALWIALLVPPAGAQESPVAREWRQTLAEIDLLLKASGWAEAEGKASGLIDDMLAETEADPKGKGLAMAVLLRAVAEAGQGRTEDALWDWMVAQNLDPVLHGARLAAYGDAGALLERHRLRQAGKPPGGIEVELLASTMTPPRSLGDDLSEYPQPHHTKQEPVTEVVIDVDGRVVMPVMLDATTPKSTYLGLQALRSKEFTPALRGGRPVAVFFRLWSFSPYRLLSDVHRWLSRGPTIEEAERGELARRLAGCEEVGGALSPTSTFSDDGLWRQPFVLPWIDVETLWKRALRKGADTLVLRDRAGSFFRCQPMVER